MSCKFEDRDDLPSIFQESMEISEESPETYFLVGPKDYDMWGFRLVKRTKMTSTRTMKTFAFPKK